MTCRSRGAVFCARAISTARNGASKQPKGRRSAERRVLRDRSALSGALPPGRGRGAAPTLTLPRKRGREWEGAARLPALYRGSLPGFLCLAQSGPALRGRGNRPLPVQLAPSGPADEVGRPGEFPNRLEMELRAPSRAPLPLASIGRHRLTSRKTSRMDSFSSSASPDQQIPGGDRHPVDPTANHLALFV